MPASLLQTCRRLDPRWYQILFLGGFLAYGLLALGWRANLQAYAILTGSCLVAQLGIAHWHTGRYDSWKSALITALSLCLLLKANTGFAYALAGTAAILGKQTLRWRGKHVINPANFGLILAILLTGDAWISPGQWGHANLVLLLAGLGGLFLLRRIGRLDTTLVFLLSFAALHFLREVAYLGWPLDHWAHQLSNGALAVFAFFMLTDPRSIPDHARGRMLWAVLIAMLAFALGLAGEAEALGLEKLGRVHAAPLWALFFMAPLVPLIDRWLPAARFQWAAAAPPPTTP